MVNLSVIVCSRNNKLSEDILYNIENTIGCIYELIVIDNSENQYSIFEAYNKGIKNSKGKYLCFVHDDILFHTPKWGKVLNQIFDENNKIGLIGIAGSKIKTRMPSSWWHCPEKFLVINILQHTINHKIEKQVLGFQKNSVLEEVVVIDGVFMAMRKVNNILFNPKMKGFHNYDLNIAFEYKKNGFKIGVTNQILIEHFSQGKIDKSWYASTLRIHNLYKKYLPLKTNNKIDTLDEAINGNYFMREALHDGEKKVAFIVWYQLFLKNPFSKNHLYYLKKFFK